jgi:hypothetical protein
MPTPPKSEIPYFNRFRNDSLKPVITINSKYGRLYFSLFAIKSLQLDKGFVRIFRDGKSWYLSRSDNPEDFRLTLYQHAYYIVSLSLVRELVFHFKHERLSFLIDGVGRKRKYYPLTFYVPDPSKARRQYGSVKAESRYKDPKMISAERVLSKFDDTNFAGRVKTNETLRAEQLLNRT